MTRATGDSSAAIVPRRRASRALVATALAVGVAWSAACAPASRLGEPPAPSAAAAAGARGLATPRGGTIVVGLTEGVEAAHAPTPTNGSERLVFRNLYETLVRVDRDGAIRPGLASHWTRSPDGREWTFVLREDARLWDGTPLEAADVRLSWMATERRDRAAGRAAPWTWLDGGAESVGARDRGRITVRLVAPVGDAPSFLAHPALAVADRRRGETWPVGTGAFRPIGDASNTDRDLLCLPNEQRQREDAPWVRLVFRARPGSDPRDLHAEGVDALLVRDRATLDYFATASGFSDAALPDDRLYVLLAPGARSDGMTLTWRYVISDLVRVDLAGAVVMSAADPASSILPEATPRDEPCPPTSMLTGASPVADDSGKGQGGEREGCASRVIYREDDSDARRLAERLAFLTIARCMDLNSQRTVPLPSGKFEKSLAAGTEDAYIVLLDRSDATTCERISALARAAPWLAPILEEIGSESLPPGESVPSGARLAAGLAERGVVIPLVATRAHLVTRAGLVGIEVDGDGAVRFDRAGWTEEATAR